MYIKIFTYSDYLNYKRTFENLWNIVENKNAIKYVHDFSSTYHLINKHDKIFKTLFDNKKDATKFINKVLKTHITEDNIEEYNISFVSNLFQNNEANIVYKLKDNNIFILIEYLSKIDYFIPYRILEYEMQIMKNAIDLSKIKNKNYSFPAIFPIVLYTGTQTWNVEFSNYNLVDIHICSKK